MNTMAHDRLPTKTKLMYGVGDFGIAMTDNMLALLIAIFLTDVVGLPPYLAAIAVFIGRSWDYINDPLLGYLSDRVRTRWGRRRPFILFGILPYAVTFSLLWWRPPIESPYWLAAYYALAYIFYDACITLISMPYYALTPELTENYDERTRLTSVRFVFSIIGTMTAFVLPMALIGEMHPNNQGKVWAVGAAIGVVGALPLLLTFFGTRERAEFQQQPKPELRESLRAAWNCIPFRYTMGIFLCTFVGLEAVVGMMIYFLKYRMDLESAFEIIAAVLFVVALLSLPFWNWLSGKFSKRSAFIAGLLFMTAVVTLILFIQPAWGLPGMLVIAILAGFGFGCIQVLPWAIIPDVVEWDEYHSGQRHEGLFYSLVLLFRKAAVSLVVPAGLLILQWTGYVANAPSQPGAVITGITLMLSVVPAVFFLFGSLLARLLPITREAFNQMRDALNQRRAAGSTATRE